MPTYEYQCSKCGHHFEAFQKMSEQPLLACPACHTDSLQKLLTPAGFQLKGKGWYKTDYTKSKEPAGETKTSKENPESKKEKTDTKTETTTKTDTSSGST